MPAFDRCLLTASLALAFSLPAFAQVKTTPAPAKPAAAAAKPAAAPAGSPNFKEVKLKTAMDGEVTYRFDNATNLPVSARDDRAEVMATGLSFLPKKQGEGLRWSFYYALQFSGKVKPTLVTVYAENKAPMLLEVGDSAPVIDAAGTWTANSKAQVVDKKTWDSMIGKDPWVLQRKFVISYADGSQRTLHQLSVVTQVMRLGLLEKVTGQKLLEPAKQ